MAKAEVDETAHRPGEDQVDGAKVTRDGVSVNASGHRDQLRRQYSLIDACGLGLTIDNAWGALGGALTVSIANGGPPGVLYELIVATFYYGFVAASIAELVSSIPSSGGVYHWASVAAGRRYGRVTGYFAGWINFFGWIFALASIVNISASICVDLYRLYHDGFEPRPWHTYVAYICITCLGCAVTVFANWVVPHLQKLGIFLILVGGFVTIVVVAAMPAEHASTAFVWRDYTNATGWSDGVSFLAGVLNGAFVIGTTDAVTHMAEELPNPRADLPKAVAAQLGLGFVTAFLYAIAILYGINDLDAVLQSPGAFSLTEIYAQATNRSRGATTGLLIILLLNLLICMVGLFITDGRIWWTLARDRAVPFANFFSRVDERKSCPVFATIWCAVLVIGFGAIPLGSKIAFLDLTGSFVILTSTSYLLAIVPHMLSGRSNVPRGPFWMGSYGMPINGVAVVSIIFFDIFYCFPFAVPVTPVLMNYNSVILVGCALLAAIWWFVHAARHYPGPALSKMYIEEDVVPEK